MLLYSKKILIIKNLSRIFKSLKKKYKNEILSKSTEIIIIISIILREEKYINYNYFILLIKLLGEVIGVDTIEYFELLIYLIINQFLYLKKDKANILYEISILEYIFIDITQKELLIQKTLPLLILIFNNFIDIEPIYDDKIDDNEKREHFLKFLKDNESPYYKILIIINMPNKILEQILLYYFEYRFELYFNKIKKINENKKNLKEELLGKISRDYLQEALLFLNDGYNWNNNIGNKYNLYNLGKLFCIAYIKKYINIFVRINKDYLNKEALWENINNILILYCKSKQYRRMIKYYILKQYSKMFNNEIEFVSSFSSYKFHDFKFELNKSQFEYNMLPYKFKSEYSKVHEFLATNKFNKSKFQEYLNKAKITIDSDFYFCIGVNNDLFHNFNNDFYIIDNFNILMFFKEIISHLNDISEKAKMIFRLLDSNEFNSSVKLFIGNKLTLKKYEIFLYALRFSLISASLDHRNFYSDLLSNDCFKTLSENFIPGKTASINKYKESYEIIKENLSKYPLSYGAYVCSCGLHYSLENNTFPTNIFQCIDCHENIGGTNMNLFKREGHMRIFINSETRTKILKNNKIKINNMLLNEFYDNIVIKQLNMEERYKDNKRFMGCSKKDFLKLENIRNLEIIPFRIINFILFSHLFISRLLNYINDENLQIFTVKGMSIFESLEADWDILDKFLRQKKIKNVQIFLNAIFPGIQILINNCDYFENHQKYINFENLVQIMINDSLKNRKDIKNYKNMNLPLLKIDHLSDMAIIYEKYPPQIYKNNFPDIELFINTLTPNIEIFKKNFGMISNPEDKYPLLNIILSQDMKIIELLKEIAKINRLSNYLMKKYNLKYSRESADNIKISSLSIYNEIKDYISDFINAWHKIRPIIRNYGNKKFGKNNSYFTEININSPISYFFVDEGEFGYGMVLAAIYKKSIELQNIFLNQIIYSKSEILSCFKEEINQEIMIQEATINEIINLDKINNNILLNIIIKNTLPNIFNNEEREITIEFDTICTFQHNYENIEMELGNILLPGLRRFIPDKIRFFNYEYEELKGKKSIISTFYEKYPQIKLNKEQVKYVLNFVGKSDVDVVKIYQNLVILIDFLQKKNYDKTELLNDIILKLPNNIYISDELKQFFSVSEKEKIGYNPLSRNINNIFFSMNTLINLFELLEHLSWDTLKESLIIYAQLRIDSIWGQKIVKYFNEAEYNQDKKIKKIIFCTALRKFISRYIKSVKEENNLLNEIMRLDLWELKIAECDSFKIEIEEIRVVMIDPYDGYLKVGQALDLYNLLGEDKKKLNNTKIIFEY